GTLFGATILGKEVPHNAFGKKLMAVYNKKGIFSNTNDSADTFSGMTATTAALAALHKVRETGKGESIDIAMYEVMLRMGQYFM
ncbi:CoA transferase, partial [Salmonella enterica subsp. enterica serovar Virginia]|nr:CoA transferase [Salmonella enterica subsp. enterica serovar Virginia]